MLHAGSEEPKVGTKIRWRGLRVQTSQPVAAFANMATEGAFRTGFKPRQPSIDAGNIARLDTSALYHASHQRGAFPIPLEYRLVTT